MNFTGKYLLCMVLCMSLIVNNDGKTNNKASPVEEVNDIKEFKKLLRTKTNVLALFVFDHKRAAPITKVFKDSADIIKGQGTMVYVDCNGEGKKLCKKMKVSNDSYLVRHFKDGEFNKDYTRKETVQSFVNFMKDPTGDLPWEEEPAAVNITHIANPQSLQKLLMKEQRPVMVMFYAPWCGFCKKLKPDYAAAATELKDYAVLAAIDVNRPENAAVRTKHNITGFPTLLYFRNGELKYTYEGDNNKDKLVEFMKNPEKKLVKERDVDWFESTDVKHLDSDTFDTFMKNEKSVLVMFYAPWCGHCKTLKPEYLRAAKLLKESKVPGSLAAVDCSKETSLSSKFKVSGYPTMKYFENGLYAFDVSVRNAEKILLFMKTPNQKNAVSAAVKAEVPWTEQSTEVVHLTVENIKPELRKKRHALVMFYAPWCGHCKKANPEYIAAAEKLKENSRVFFGAVDCSVHETLCRTFDVKGYPTFKYFHYYNKATADYNGGRMTADFVNYISNADTTVLKDAQKTKDEL